AQIQIPCTENPPAPSGALEDAPYLLADPTCGTLTEFEGAPGSTVTLTGHNFIPNTRADIWWKDPIGNEFRQRQGGEYINITPDENGAFKIDIVLPYRLVPANIRDDTTIWEIQIRQVASIGDWQFSTELKLAIEKIIETIFIGMMATFFGILLALPVSFFAARNLMSASPITLGIYFITRTILNIIRSIEPLIWAIIFVVIVGLGPFAGIMALTIHSIAALGKLYSESIESIDPGPIEAIQATGANWLQVVVYAVIPQIVPPFVSFTIYRWDINIRMSTIIGFVGGGGIGFLLSQWIRLMDYKAAGIAVWFIAITVAILDFVSAEVRQRFV
ncbi:MAG: phosphonate ABC transporter, permease protein PhnE, partial [Anaerolineales bacterium]